jgi:hypothetical protein
MRVCQFRHDGKWTCVAAAATKAAVSGRLLFYSTAPIPRVKLREPALVYASFAVIVIFAFSTFDTGHPFSAFSAHF